MRGCRKSYIVCYTCFVYLNGTIPSSYIQKLQNWQNIKQKVHLSVYLDMDHVDQYSYCLFLETYWINFNPLMFTIPSIYVHTTSIHLIDKIMKIKKFQGDRLTHLHYNTHCSYKRVYLQNQIFTFPLQERFVYIHCWI